MSKNSSIEWTDHTFNPWWGCTRVSPGCEHCYAESFAKRVGQKVWGVQAPRRFFGDKHWNEPLSWNQAAEDSGVRARVFCASMADVFEDRPELAEHRTRLFQLIAETSSLDWLLLTKRPENVMRLVPESWRERFPRNVWMGTTVEDRPRGDRRVPVLRALPAAVHFLSVEPLLEDLGAVDLAGIEWMIVGGESGPGARHMDPAWVRSLRDQCVGQGVAFLFKQWGGVLKKKYGRSLDGRTWDELPAAVL